MSISTEQRDRLSRVAFKAAEISHLGYDANAQELLVMRKNPRAFDVHSPVTPEEFDALTKAPDLARAIGNISRDKLTSCYVDASKDDYAGAKTMTFVGYVNDGVEGQAHLEGETNIDGVKLGGDGEAIKAE